MAKRGREATFGRSQNRKQNMAANETAANKAIKRCRDNGLGRMSTSLTGGVSEGGGRLLFDVVATGLILTYQRLPYINLRNSKLSRDLQWFYSSFECSADSIDFSSAHWN